MGALPENEFMFHAAATFATGGMLLSGDDLTKMTPQRVELLKKLRPTGNAAAFDGEFRVGRMKVKGRELVIVLNWQDGPADAEFALEKPAQVRDFLTGEDLGRQTGRYQVKAMTGHSGRVYELAG
jgi:alpha-galactosidase